MADSLKFSKGLQQYLPSTLEDNTFYVTTDTHKIYLQGGVWEDTSSINETIGEIEEVVAESLTDLDARLKVIEDKTSDSETEEEPNVSETLVKVTYSELLQLRTHSQLIPGVKYRITDYVTTTNQDNTQSANHPFDIIVEALSENSLSENAKAIQNENDDYFDDSNLEAWELKYCLDNDSNRFAWIKSSHDVDSSLVSIDETLVDGFQFKVPFACDYFLSIDTNAYMIGIEDGELFYEYGRATNPDGLENQLCIYKSDADLWEEEGADYDDKFFYYGTEIINDIEYDKWRKSCTHLDELTWVDNVDNVKGGNKLFITKKITKNSDSLIINEMRTGVIYYMKDEYGNECPYDFKNIMFYDDSEGDFFYTFSFNNQDLTLLQHLTNDEGFCYGTHHNIIKPNYLEDSSNLIQALNKNIFILTNDYQSEYYGCYNNIFNINCHDNIIYCNGFRNNVFGENCYDNTFGYYCINNTFGNDCINNTFGNDCINNTFGNECNYNTFGNECNVNIFGNECNDNTFGNVCHNNTFGTYCINNTFDDSCYNNTFGNDCHNNSFGNLCYGNSFGNGCIEINFRDNHTYSFEKDELRYEGGCLPNVNSIKLSNNCSYLLFYKQYGSSVDALQNITVTSGVKGTKDNLLVIDKVYENNDYETKVARNSKGEIKIYCEADLIA